MTYKHTTAQHFNQSKTQAVTQTIKKVRRRQEEERRTRREPERGCRSEAKKLEWKRSLRKERREHKEQLEKLKQKDPEFYQFWQERDEDDIEEEDVDTDLESEEVLEDEETNDSFLPGLSSLFHKGFSFFLKSKKTKAMETNQTNVIMGVESENLEERLKSFLSQLRAECGVYERIVYKNKNQHRRCSYFHYLLKVRRDLRLLLSTNLEELVGFCFQVITGNKPRQKIHLLESLKWRKRECGKPNFLERLLGAARLLSQMIEPMLKAATELSTLLAQSFFMGFALTNLALLARLRVLVQQVLIDVVSVFGIVSSISQKKQSLKITLEEIEIFREYYPTNKEFVTLECVWKTDKFVLLEKTHKIEVKCQDGDVGDASVTPSVLQYQSIEAFLGDDSDTENADEDYSSKKGLEQVKEAKEEAFAGPSIANQPTTCTEQVEDGAEKGVTEAVAETPTEQLVPEIGALGTSSSPSLRPLASKSGAKQVAFVSVKRPASPTAAAFVSVKKPATSTANVSNIHPNESKEVNKIMSLSKK